MGVNSGCPRLGSFARRPWPGKTLRLQVSVWLTTVHAWADYAVYNTVRLRLCDFFHVKL